jgi:hypothetical protein
MMRRVPVAAALAAAVFAALAASSSANVIEKCVWNARPGTEVVNKAAIRIFCGPAKATVHAGGVTSKRSNGACYKAPGSVTLGLGKYSVAPYTPIAAGLLLVIPAPKDGRYSNAFLTLLSKGKSSVATKVKAVLSDNRSRGTFSGTFVHGPRFTGTFSCK